MVYYRIQKASAELAAVAAIKGYLPTPDEYREIAGSIDHTAADTYRYLNFDQISEYVDKADKVEQSEEYYPTLQKELERLKSL